MQGLALGCIGMSRADFLACTFDEFESIAEAWQQMNESRYRDDWERSRMVAAFSIQPHVRKRITPRQLLPLPWDSKAAEKKRQQPTILSAQERFRRFKKLIKKG